MLNSRLVLISLSLKPVYHLHFCHACLNLLMDELVDAQCSSFLKHHEWTPAMYFVVLFECCSMFILMHLDGYLMFIAHRCHICFACHFQTVHPIPVIFISISTESTSTFQWHSWISKLRPGPIIPFQIMHMHRIPHPAYHTMFMCWLFTLVFASFRCCFFGLVPITSCCEDLFDYVCLSSSWTRSSSLRDLRQDDHTLEITSIFAC